MCVIVSLGLIQPLISCCKSSLVVFVVERTNVFQCRNQIYRLVVIVYNELSCLERLCVHWKVIAEILQENIVVEFERGFYLEIDPIVLVACGFITPCKVPTYTVQCKCNSGWLYICRSHAEG